MDVVSIAAGVGFPSGSLSSVTTRGVDQSSLGVGVAVEEVGAGASSVIFIGSRS